jgi:ankyrin repeat protein
VDATDLNGQTALHKACEKRNLDIVQCLVERGGANIVAACNKGLTPIHTFHWLGTSGALIVRACE